MKLLLCKECQDVVKPLIGKKRWCQCGKCSVIGHDDNVTVFYSGENAIMLGLANSSLRSAVISQPFDGLGKEFVAFVIAKKCITAIKIEHENSSHTS